jgi:hypothetical protein
VRTVLFTRQKINSGLFHGNGIYGFPPARE